MDIRSLATTFLETFDGSARAEFESFMRRYPLTKTWLISADYVIGDTGRPNDVFAFSIMPYVDEISVLRARLAKGMPRDLKATKSLTPAAKHVLRGPEVFHVPVILPKHRLIMGATGAQSVVNGRRVAADLVRDALEMERGDVAVNVMRRLEKVTRRKGYNHRLLADVLLLGMLLPLLSVAILRERSGSEVVWMSDRDSMTEWCGGALWHIAQLNVRGIAESLHLNPGAMGPGVCVPTADGTMWFDEMIRLPDHMAGALAAWDTSTDEPASTSNVQLISDMLGEIFAGADNVAVIRLRAEPEGFGWCRILFETR